MAVLSVVVLLCGLAPGRAEARRPATQSRSALSWHRGVSGFAHLAIHGDYLAYSSAFGSRAVTVLDLSTRRRFTLSAPANCAFAAGSVTQLAFTCTSSDPTDSFAVLLYTLATRSWSAPPDTALNVRCGIESDRSCQIITLGSSWIEWDAVLDQGGHDFDDVQYEHISTGNFRSAVSDVGGRTWDNPDSSTLTDQLCEPLRVPGESDDPYDGEVPGGITFHGRFAVLQEGSESAGPQAFLAECGTRLHEALQTSADFRANESGGVAGDRSLLAWLDGSQNITYLRLPERRTGSLAPPIRGSMVQGASLAIADGDIFFVADDVVWSARLPHLLI